MSLNINNGSTTSRNGSPFSNPQQQEDQEALYLAPLFIGVLAESDVQTLAEPRTANLRKLAIKHIRANYALSVHPDWVRQASSSTSQLSKSSNSPALGLLKDPATLLLYLSVPSEQPSWFSKLLACSQSILALRNEDARSLLHVACQWKNKDRIKLISKLLEICPKLIGTRDRFQKLPFDLLDKNGSRDIIEYGILFTDGPSEKRCQTLALLCELENESLAHAYLKYYPCSLLPIAIPQSAKVEQGKFVPHQGELPLAVCAGLGKKALFDQLLKNDGTGLPGYLVIAFSGLQFNEAFQPLKLYLKGDILPESALNLVCSHPLLTPIANRIQSSLSLVTQVLIKERIIGCRYMEEYQVKGSIHHSDLVSILISLVECEDLPLAHKTARYVMEQSGDRQEQHALLKGVLEHFAIEEGRSPAILRSLATDYVTSFAEQLPHDSAVIAPLLWRMDAKSLRQGLLPKLKGLRAERALLILGQGLEHAPQQLTARLDLLYHLGCFNTPDPFGSSVHPLSFLKDNRHPMSACFLEWTLDKLSFVREAVSTPLMIIERGRCTWPILMNFVDLDGYHHWTGMAIPEVAQELTIQKVILLLPYSLKILGKGFSPTSKAQAPKVGELLLFSASKEVVRLLKAAGFVPRKEKLKQVLLEVLKKILNADPNGLQDLLTAYESYHPDGVQAIDQLDWIKILEPHVKKIHYWPTLSELAKKYPAVKQSLHKLDPVVQIPVKPSAGSPVTSESFRDDLSLAATCGFPITAEHMDRFFLHRPRKDVYWIIRQGYGALPSNCVEKRDKTRLFTAAVRAIHEQAEALLESTYRRPKRDSIRVLKKDNGIEIIASSPSDDPYSYRLSARQGVDEVLLEQGYYSAPALIKSASRLLVEARQKLSLVRAQREFSPYFGWCQGAPMTVTDFERPDSPNLPVNFTVRNDGSIKCEKLELINGARSVVSAWNILAAEPDPYTAVKGEIQGLEKALNEDVKKLREICAELNVKVDTVKWGPTRQADIDWSKSPTPGMEIRIFPSRRQFFLRHNCSDKFAAELPREQLFSLRRLYPLNPQKAKAYLQRSLDSGRRYEKLANFYLKDRDNAVLLPPRNRTKPLAYEIYDRLKERKASKNAEWGMSPLPSRTLILCKDLAVLGGRSPDLEKTLGLMRSVSAFAQGDIRVSIEKLNAHIVDLIPYSCPSQEAPVKIMDMVEKDAPRFFTGKGTTRSRANIVVSNIQARDGFFGLKKEKDADKYREMYIQLSHIYHTLKQRSDDEELKLLLQNLANYHQDCGFGITQFVNLEYLRIVNQLDPSSTGSNDIISELISGAIQDLINALNSFAQHPEAQKQTRHLRNYLRRELGKMGYKLPRDPMVGDSGQDASRDIYLGGDYVADYPQKQLKEIFHSLLIPAIVQRIVDKQEECIQKADYAGALKLQNAFVAAIEEWQALPDKTLTVKLQESRQAQTAALEAAREEAEKSRVKQQEQISSSREWETLSQLRKQEDQLYQAITSHRQVETQLQLGIQDMTDDKVSETRKSVKRARSFSSSSTSTTSSNTPQCSQAEYLQLALSQREEKRQKLERQQKAVEKLLMQLETGSLFKDLLQGEQKVKDSQTKARDCATRFVAQRKALILDYALEGKNGFMEECEALGDMEILTVKGICCLLQAKGILLPNSPTLTSTSSWSQLVSVVQGEHQQTTGQVQDEINNLGVAQNFYMD